MFLSRSGAAAPRAPGPAEVEELVPAEVPEVDPEDAGAREASQPTAGDRKLHALAREAQKPASIFGRNSSTETRYLRND
jgi:hypothetical protein